MSINTNLSKIEHPLQGLHVNVVVAGMKYARCITSRGPDIVDDWPALLTAACVRELHARSFLMTEPDNVVEDCVGEMDTLRGVEHVFYVYLRSGLDTALVTLSVLEDEFLIHGLLEEEDWVGAAENLLRFEVDDDHYLIDVSEREGRLDMAVTEGNGLVRWQVEGVVAGLEEIADAIVTYSLSVVSTETTDAPHGGSHGN